MIWLSSDSHFCHSRIIEYCNRPFRHIDEMNETIIANHNSVVSPDDEVYFLGDFALKVNPNMVNNILRRLNGKLFLIPGSHDKRFDEWDLTVLPRIFELPLPGERYKLVMCHYPMRSWPASFHGAPHIFGHVHSRLDNVATGLSIDVGVDSHNFTPVSLEYVLKAVVAKNNRFAGKDKQE